MAKKYPNLELKNTLDLKKAEGFICDPSYSGLVVVRLAVKDTESPLENRLAERFVVDKDSDGFPVVHFAQEIIAAQLAKMSKKAGFSSLHEIMLAEVECPEAETVAKVRYVLPVPVSGGRRYAIATRATYTTRVHKTSGTVGLSRKIHGEARKIENPYYVKSESTGVNVSRYDGTGSAIRQGRAGTN